MLATVGPMFVGAPFNGKNNAIALYIYYTVAKLNRVGVSTNYTFIKINYEEYCIVILLVNYEGLFLNTENNDTYIQRYSYLKREVNINTVVQFAAFIQHSSNGQEHSSMHPHSLDWCKPA